MPDIFDLAKVNQFRQRIREIRKRVDIVDFTPRVGCQPGCQVGHHDVEELKPLAREYFPDLPLPEVTLNYWDSRLTTVREVLHDALDQWVRWLEGYFGPALPKGKPARRGAKKKQLAKPFILFHGEREYSIGGSERKTLSETEHMVLQAFLGPPALRCMDKPTLCKRSVDHAPRVLRRLQTKYGRIFADSIDTPQGKKASGGYSVRIKTAVT
jgi:hypothetical protein